MITGMGCVLLVGNCYPLGAKDIENSGHEVLVAANEKDAWKCVLPGSNSRENQYPDIVVLGCDLPEVERRGLLRWVQEECSCLSVLVMNTTSDPPPDAFGYYSVSDTGDTALGVIMRLIDGMARNGPA